MPRSQSDPADQIVADRIVPDTFDHGDERLLRESLYEIRPGCIDIHHPRRDPDVGKPAAGEEGVHFPSDKGISAHPFLQGDKAMDGFIRLTASRIEISRTMVPLDDRDGPAGFEDLFEACQCQGGIMEVFEDEANKYMVERLFAERGDGRYRPARMSRSTIRPADTRDLASEEGLWQSNRWT